MPSAISRAWMAAVTLGAAFALSGSQSLCAQLRSGEALLALPVDSSAGAPPLPGCGGLFVFEAFPGTAPGVRRLSGVPAELSGCRSGGRSVEGARAVVEDARTGRAWALGSLDGGDVVLCELAVVGGTAVQVLRRVVLGQRGIERPEGGLVVLPDGRLVIGLTPAAIEDRGSGAAPFAGTLLGLFDPNLPPGDPRVFRRIAVDPAFVLPPEHALVGLAPGRTPDHLVFAVTDRRGGRTTLYEHPVEPAGGGPPPTPRVLTVTLQIARTMVREPAGTYLVGGYQVNGLGVSFEVLVRFDPVTRRPTLFRRVNRADRRLGTLGVDPVSGDLWLVTRELRTGTSRLERVDGARFDGSPQPVSGGPAGGAWGAAAGGLSLRSAVAAYGAASGGAARPVWRTAPVADGLPEVGNVDFALELDLPATAPVPTQSALVGSAVAGRILLSLREPVIVWLGGALVPAPLLPPSRGRLRAALAVPRDPGLVGAEVFLQVLTLDSGGALAASPGLRVRLR